jgi:hypothetical protein
VTGTLQGSRLTAPPLARLEAARLVCIGVILTGAAVCLTLNWPGHFTYDSVVQLAEGRATTYSGVHPPVMSWLLGAADRITPGAAAFVALDVALIDGALLLLVLTSKRVTWAACALAALCQALPQLLIYPAIVWKDVLFAGAMCLGFALLAHAAAAWAAPRRRFAWLAGALAALVLAALARQNGPIVLPIAAAVVGWIAARESGRWRSGMAHGAGFLALGAALAIAAGAALDERLDGPSPLRDSVRGLQTLDLVSALDREPSLDLPVLHRQAPAAEALLRSQGVALFSPERIDAIAPVIERMTSMRARPEVIAAEWRGLVLRHPLLYLRVRASAFRWVFASPRPDRCVLIETGVDGDAEDLAAAGLAERDTPRDEALERYALSLGGTPVYWHATYAAAGLALFVLLLRRRTSADIAVAGMIASGLAFAASFAVISIACDYRYLYALDVVAIAAALYASASGGRPDVRKEQGARLADAA